MPVTRHHCATIVLPFRQAYSRSAAFRNYLTLIAPRAGLDALRVFLDCRQLTTSCFCLFYLLCGVLLFCRMSLVVAKDVSNHLKDFMNSFHFEGRVASAPTITHPGNSTVCKFTLIRNEFTGSDEQGNARPERKVAIQFTAFGKRGEAIGQHAMEGDQLIVTARVGNNDYPKDGVQVYGFDFIVEDWSFGAPGAKKREQLAARKGGNT